MKPTRNLCLALCAAMGLWNSPASSAVVEYLPQGGYQSVSANVPAYGNVWNGVAQSVMAVDANVTFGFYMFGATGPQNIVYTLYDGSGVTGAVLATRAVSFAGGTGFSSPQLASADFSSVSLIVGHSYTFGVSMASGAPAAGQYSTASIEYASTGNYDNVDESIYPGGRFYYIGSSYDAAPYWIDRDIAFRMEGVTSPLPEPSAWTMMVLGFGAIGGLMRSRVLKTRLA